MAENDEVHKSLYKMISKNSEILACQTYIEGHREDEVSGGQKQNFVQEALEEKSTKCSRTVASVLERGETEVLRLRSSGSLPEISSFGRGVVLFTARTIWELWRACGDDLSLGY